jgi:DNA-binding transcriptional MerR regulator
VDRYTGYRYYSLQQLPRLNRLLALRELGFPLAQIERLLREGLSSGEIQRLMRCPTLSNTMRNLIPTRRTRT